MKFLEKYEFNKEEIDEFINNTPKKIMESIKEYRGLIESNLSYLKDLNINTYKEIFIYYPDMFFMDHSNFKEVFDKYERDSLVEKLNKNYKIVEFL